jgi:hypothetical protein
LTKVLKIEPFAPFQLVLAATYSGAFHPTAEGEAAIADAIVSKARAVLSKYGQGPDDVSTSYDDAPAPAVPEPDRQIPDVQSVLSAPHDAAPVAGATPAAVQTVMPPSPAPQATEPHHPVSDANATLTTPHDAGGVSAAPLAPAAIPASEPVVQAHPATPSEPPIAKAAGDVSVTPLAPAAASGPEPAAAPVDPPVPGTTDDPPIRPFAPASGQPN